MDICYPLYSTPLNSRISLHSKKEWLTIFNNTKDNVLDKKSEKEKEIFTIPYVNSISESFIPVIKKHGFNIAFSIPDTLNTLIKCGKDRLDLMSQQGVVYKISCHDCEASYVGQTKRQLRMRIKEYVADINKKSGSPSVISEHRINFNHDFEWDNVKIRLISEMEYKKTAAQFK